MEEPGGRQTPGLMSSSPTPDVFARRLGTDVQTLAGVATSMETLLYELEARNRDLDVRFGPLSPESVARARAPVSPSYRSVASFSDGKPAQTTTWQAPSLPPPTTTRQSWVASPASTTRSSITVSFPAGAVMSPPAAEDEFHSILEGRPAAAPPPPPPSSALTAAPAAHSSSFSSRTLQAHALHRQLAALQEEMRQRQREVADSVAVLDAAKAEWEAQRGAMQRRLTDLQDMREGAQREAANLRDRVEGLTARLTAAMDAAASDKARIASLERECADVRQAAFDAQRAAAERDTRAQTAVEEATSFAVGSAGLLSENASLQQRCEELRRQAEDADVARARAVAELAAAQRAGDALRDKLTGTTKALGLAVSETKAMQDAVAAREGASDVVLDEANGVRQQLDRLRQANASLAADRDRLAAEIGGLQRRGRGDVGGGDTWLEERAQLTRRLHAAEAKLAEVTFSGLEREQDRQASALASTHAQRAAELETLVQCLMADLAASHALIQRLQGATAVRPPSSRHQPPSSPLGDLHTRVKAARGAAQRAMASPSPPPRHQPPASVTREEDPVRAQGVDLATTRLPATASSGTLDARELRVVRSDASLGFGHLHALSPAANGTNAREVLASPFSGSSTGSSMIDAHQFTFE